MVRVLVPVPVQGLVPVPALVRVHGTASIHQGQKLCLVSKVRRALVPRCMLRRRSKINQDFNIGFSWNNTKILLDDPSRLAPYGVYFANAL